MILLDRHYRPPFYLWNGHVHTVYASRYRKSMQVPYKRERWETPDKDFLDVDLIQHGKRDLIIIGHGLEGHSRRPYITNTAKLFSDNGWDVCAWNCRSCSGEINRQPKLYSHADTSDLAYIIEKMSMVKYGYENIVLLGYSMGGAIIMNYLGQIGENVQNKLKAGIAISSPCDIQAASGLLENGIKQYYKHYFMSQLKEKIKLKAGQYPELINVGNIDAIDSWREFDNSYSAPLGGYADAEEFYYYCSAKHRIPDIRLPTLLLNAYDDPLLTKESYPEDIIRDNKHMYALYTRKGGHSAFIRKGKNYTYSEVNALKFANAALSSKLENFCKQFEKS